MKQRFFILLFLCPLLLFGQKGNISLEDIWRNGTFRTQGIQGFKSMNDGEHFTEIEKGVLVKKSFATAKKVSEFSFYKDLSYQGEKLSISSFEFNATEDKMLLFTEPEHIYRHSAFYKVYVYDIKKGRIQLVDEAKIMHASFSPKADKIAFVKDNNLYYYDLVLNQTIQITKDGSNNIINGNCDWVYEEEFGFTKAFEWSPNGDYIAFYRFDQSEVPLFTMMYFNALYPEKYEFKYPKAGDTVSEIRIGLYKVGGERTNWVQLSDFYVPRIKWTTFDENLVVFGLNRHQNELKYWSVDMTALENPDNQNLDYGTSLPNTIVKNIFSEKNNAYIEISDQQFFLKKQNAFLYVSEKNGFNHIYLFDIPSQQSRQITNGYWEVTELYGLDEETGTIYYSSTEKSPLERNLYSIKKDGSNKKLLTPEKGWHEISFSNRFNYFVDNYSSISTPPVYTLKNKRGDLIRTLKDNQSLLDKMKDYRISNLELIEVPIGKDILLHGWLIKPTEVTTGKKYPLIMYQYSGPGSQEVKNKWGPRDFWWYQMLAEQGYAIACVDGRGTGFRGEKFKKLTYQQLGKYESEDQIAAAQYFGSLPYIDKKRIGIWGWSYGGYMSSICIAKGADVFKSAIAVAPVTNWRYYDNIYTERYMRTPKENASGYDDNSPVNMVGKIKGNYLLIHGSGDDNVHYQNTMEMIKAMVNADVDFDSEIYPNKNHGISGGNTRYHLYRRMTRFWLEKL